MQQLHPWSSQQTKQIWLNSLAARWHLPPARLLATRWNLLQNPVTSAQNSHLSSCASNQPSDCVIAPIFTSFYRPQCLRALLDVFRDSCDLLLQKLAALTQNFRFNPTARSDFALFSNQIDSEEVEQSTWFHQFRLRSHCLGPLPALLYCSIFMQNSKRSVQKLINDDFDSPGDCFWRFFRSIVPNVELIIFKLPQALTALTLVQESNQIVQNLDYDCTTSFYGDFDDSLDLPILELDSINSAPSWSLQTVVPPLCSLTTPIGHRFWCIFGSVTSKPDPINPVSNSSTLTMTASLCILTK